VYLMLRWEELGCGMSGYVRFSVNRLVEVR
jgi:hypothetical protein